MEKSLKELFPYVYMGGGYFRERGVPKGMIAETLHGMQAIEFLYNQIKAEEAEKKEQLHITI
jgi:hypothetical protein